jgi:soluble lytic murein transglycosylase-like protein
MRMRLQLALMVSSVIATFFFLTTPYVQAEAGSGEAAGTITTTTDDNGHKVYVNDYVPARPTQPWHAAVAPRSSLVYWSATEHRWKPVPRANVRAAQSAAAEVDQYLGKNAANGSPETLAPSFAVRKSFTPAEIDAAIDEAAARHGVDSNLVRAVIKVESNFNPNAVSRKGAMGLMQLMPQTARQLNVTNPFDPEQNVDAGVRHLKKLMESYGGNVQLSLAAYNAGAGAVARSAGVPHFAETRNYVKRITQLYSGEEGWHFPNSPARVPIEVHRDAQGVLVFSNTD